MGASFAKAIVPLRPKRREPGPETDWAIGWVFPIKTDVVSDESDATLNLKPFQDEPHIEDRS